MASPQAEQTEAPEVAAAPVVESKPEMPAPETAEQEVENDRPVLAGDAQTPRKTDEGNEVPMMSFGSEPKS